MNLTVKAKSKFGFKTQENADKWFNIDRNGTADLNKLSVGDNIEAVLNEAGYVTSYTVVGVKQQTTSNGNGQQKTISNTREEIARSTAVKAVLNSSYFNFDNLELSISKYTKYILTGEF